jgi:hypothetical protein
MPTIRPPLVPGDIVQWVPPSGSTTPLYGTVTGVTPDRVLVRFGRDDEPTQCFSLDLRLVDRPPTRPPPQEKIFDV